MQYVELKRHLYYTYILTYTWIYFGLLYYEPMVHLCLLMSKSDLYIHCSALSLKF